MRQTMERLACIGAQSDGDAARFIALGAEPGRVRVTGNVKFDFTLPEDLEARAAALGDRWLAGRRAWIAGSTHAGEELLLLDAQRLLESRSTDAAPLLVMAPRHPERFPLVAQWLAREGIRFVRRSDPEARVGADTQVLLLDTLGELLAFYALGEVAYVGGSLVPVGGHNLLEPAVLGKPVISGPQHFNSPEAAARLTECGALTVVQDPASLASSVGGLLADPQSAGRRGAAGREAVLRNRGAAARSVEMLGPWLPPIL
jgi:3-deoxy-D-manno-octulosonic-acid transferase